MGGRRTTKDELTQIETMIKEGLINKQIAQKLNRSPAAIRNLQYKKHLVARAKDETPILLKQRDELSNTVKALQGQKTTLVMEIDSLKKQKGVEIDNLKKEEGKLEAIIYYDKILLQNELAKALMILKQQKPDLFYLTGQDQTTALIKTIFSLVTR